MSISSEYNDLLSATSVDPLDIKKLKFKLRYAPHFGMFRHSAGNDFMDQLKFIADQGFTAFEDNGMMSRPAELQEKIGQELQRLELKMGVFVIDFKDGSARNTLADGNTSRVEKFVNSCTKAVEVAKRCKATYMTVTPGDLERSLPYGIQSGYVIDALRRGAEIFEKHNLVMVLEPLSDANDHFLRTPDQAYKLCRAVDSPACKILFDIYHVQRNEGHIISHMDSCWSEIGYFQIADNPGRNEPFSGEINYQKIFKYIHTRASMEGQDFILGMEHGNSQQGKEGEKYLLDAYVKSDTF